VLAKPQCKGMTMNPTRQLTAEVAVLFQRDAQQRQAGRQHAPCELIEGANSRRDPARRPHQPFGYRIEAVVGRALGDRPLDHLDGGQKAGIKAGEGGWGQPWSRDPRASSASRHRTRRVRVTMPPANRYNRNSRVSMAETAENRALKLLASRKTLVMATVTGLRKSSTLWDPIGSAEAWSREWRQWPP
jgi:hypothetical protein